MTYMKADAGFLFTQRPDGMWTWSWIAGLMVSGCVITGTRSFSTRAGALRSARSCVEKLRKYHVEISRGDFA